MINYHGSASLLFLKNNLIDMKPYIYRLISRKKKIKETLLDA
jgi:hypothetical protein